MQYLSRYPLPRGKRNAQTAAELCERYGITRKEFLKDLHAKKKHGYMVATCGAPPRYYTPEKAAEMKAYCAHLYFKAKKIFDEYNTCVEMIDKLPN